MEYRKFVRALTALFVVVCIGIAFAANAPDMPSAVVSAGAASATYNMSDEYKSGPYYENFVKVKLTGDQQKDVLAIALSQLGYHEGNDENQLDGTSTSGTRDFVEYNVLFGKVDNGQGNGASYGYYWCASFVNWCLRQAGVSADASGAAEISCQRWLSACKSAGIYSGKSGYMPKPADMIFFRDAGSGVSSTHIGLVLYSDGRNVYTVEGNTSSGEYSSDGEYVAVKQYELGSSYIVGYATPKYNKESSYKRVDYRPDTPNRTEGQYVSDSEIKIYEQPSSEQPLGSIDAYRIFDVAEISEDRSLFLVSYEKDGAEIKGYASIEGAAFQLTGERELYAINYLSANGSTIFPTQYRRSGEGVSTYPTAPTADEMGFVGWKLITDKAETIFSPGDKLPTFDADITLYAVWDDAFYLVTFADADGSVITQEYGYYGTKFVMPEAPEAPEGYVFSGWTPGESAIIMGNATYTATFIPESELTETESGTEQTDANNGCASSVSGAAVVLVSATLSAVVLGKKKRR